MTSIFKRGEGQRFHRAGSRTAACAIAAGPATETEKKDAGIRLQHTQRECDVIHWSGRHYSTMSLHSQKLFAAELMFKISSLPPLMGLEAGFTNKTQ